MSKYVQYTIKSVEYLFPPTYPTLSECQVTVLKQYNTIGETLKNIQNERLKKAFQNAPIPRTTVDEYDWYIISAVIIPTTLRLLRLRIEKHPDTDRLIQNAIAAAERWKTIFTHQDSIEKIIEMLKDFENNRTDGRVLAADLQSYAGSSIDPVKTVGFLIASMNTETQQSFYLQAALIKSLDETVKKISAGSYKFLLLPFLEAFWFSRINEQPGDITNVSFWTQKSISYYQNAAEDKKTRMMFRILGNHIKGITVTSDLENWIDS